MRPLWVLLLMKSVESSDETGVCDRDDCDEVDVDWEEEGFFDQLRSSLNTEKSNLKIVFCKDELDESAVSEKSVGLYRFERCDFLDYHVKYNYQGKRDGQTNKFKGKGLLTFVPQNHQSNYQRGGSHEHLKLSSGEKEDGFCIIDNAFMSIQSISGVFKEGLAQGEIIIKHNNNAQTKGQAKSGVLHGKVVMKNADNPTFIGKIYIALQAINKKEPFFANALKALHF